MTAPTPTSEPTRSHRPCTRAAAAAQRGDPATSLELDDGRDQAPADGQPDRDRQQHAGARERDPHHHERRDRAQERTQASEREAVRPHRADVPPGVDLHEGADGRGLDEAERQQGQRAADRQRDERPDTRRPRRCPRRPRRGAAKTRYWSTVMTNAVGSRISPIPTKVRIREKYIRNVERDDLPPVAAAREAQRRDRRPRRLHGEEDDEPDAACRSAAASAPGCAAACASQAEPVSTPEQKKSVAPVPKTPPVGTA